MDIITGNSGNTIKPNDPVASLINLPFMKTIKPNITPEQFNSIIHSSTNLHDLNSLSLLKGRSISVESGQGLSASPMPIFRVAGTPIYEEQHTEDINQVEEFKAKLVSFKEDLGPVYEEIEKNADELIDLYSRWPKTLEQEDKAAWRKFVDEEAELKLQIGFLMSDNEHLLDRINKETAYLETFAEDAKGPSKFGVFIRKTIDKLFGTNYAKTYISRKNEFREEFLRTHRRAVNLAAVAALKIEAADLLKPTNEVLNTKRKLESLANYVMNRMWTNDSDELVDVTELKDKREKLQEERNRLEQVIPEGEQKSVDELLPSEIKEYERQREIHNKINKELGELEKKEDYLKYEPKFKLSNLVERLLVIDTFNQMKPLDIKMGRVIENFLSPKLRQERENENADELKETFLEARVGWLCGNGERIERGATIFHDLSGNALGEFIEIEGMKSGKKLLSDPAISNEYVLVDLRKGVIYDSKDLTEALSKRKKSGEVGLFKAYSGLEGKVKKLEEVHETAPSTPIMQTKIVPFDREAGLSKLENKVKQLHEDVKAILEEKSDYNNAMPGLIKKLTESYEVFKFLNTMTPEKRATFPSAPLISATIYLVLDAIMANQLPLDPEMKAEIQLYRAMIYANKDYIQNLKSEKENIGENKNKPLELLEGAYRRYMSSDIDVKGNERSMLRLAELLIDQSVQLGNPELMTNAGWLLGKIEMNLPEADSKFKSEAMRLRAKMNPEDLKGRENALTEAVKMNNPKAMLELADLYVSNPLEVSEQSPDELRLTAARRLKELADKQDLDSILALAELYQKHQVPGVASEIADRDADTFKRYMLKRVTT